MAYTKLSVNIADDAEEALRTYMHRHQVNVTEAVRRAIAILTFLDDERMAGNTICVRDPNEGSVRELAILDGPPREVIG